MAIGHEPIVASALESVWQHVKQETPDELVRFKGQRLAGAGVVVLVREGDVSISHVQKAAIGDRDTLHVPRQVMHHGFGSGERRRDMDYPIVASGLAQ